MMLDAGALIAIARNDRAVIARLKAALAEEDEVRTHPMVVAQAWRDGARQAQLARWLRAIDVVAIDDHIGRRCGELIGKAKTSDPIDAAVVVLAHDGEPIITSDPDDLRHLVRVAKRSLPIVGC